MKKAAKGKQRAVEPPAEQTAMKKSMAANAGQGKTVKNKEKKATSKKAIATATDGKKAAPAVGPSSGDANDDGEDALRRDIADLGGDDEDYAYVKDIDTDEEVMVNETAEDVRQYLYNGILKFRYS